MAHTLRFLSNAIALGAAILPEHKDTKSAILKAMKSFLFSSKKVAK
ncbi:hypothetical protein IAD21_04255 [Abditibacteriota bacterium]|nr:hypothetical protein IAD21_04255 [Abditibacteriota bacterium]